MKPLSKNQSRYLAIGLLSLCLIIVGLSIFIPVRLLHRHYDDAIASRNDYLERYQRIIANGDKIRSALDLVKKSNGRRHFLKNTSAALAASEIQETAKNLIDANGGKLISMQIAPSKDEDAYRRVTVNIQLSCSMAALRQILYAVETMQPYLLVDNISIRSPMNNPFRPGAEAIQPDLMVGFDLSGYTLVVAEK
ncbi:MAG: type II secretion system protein GspM [Gallionellaceae bacterium]